MPTLARVLTVDMPGIGVVGDIIEWQSAPEPFSIAVSALSGETRRLTVTGAMQRQIKAGWLLSIDNQEAFISTSMVFTAGSPLEEQTTLELASDIIVPSGGWTSERAEISPTTPTIDGVSGVELIELDNSTAELVRLSHHFDGTTVPKYSIDPSSGEFVEKTDTRFSVEITIVDGAPLNHVDPDGTLELRFTAEYTEHEDPDHWIVGTGGTPVSVPFANGIATYAMPLDQPGVFLIRPGRGYMGAPMEIVVTETAT
jgi:hypothetical protein